MPHDKHTLPAKKHYHKFTTEDLVAAYRKWESDCRMTPEKFQSAEDCRATSVCELAEANARALLNYLGK